MDFFTHMTVAALIYKYFLGGLESNYFGIALLFSILPDLDIILTPIRRKFKLKYLEHRAASHSYFIGVIISIISSLFYTIFTGNNFFITVLVCILFYSLHISMDLLTTTRIPILYPFSKKEPSFYCEKAGSQYTMIISLIFWSIIIPLNNNGSYPDLVNGLTIILSLFFFIHYSSKIITKYKVSKNISPDHTYLPGVFPFYYSIVKNEILDGKLKNSIIRGSIFSDKRIIIENNENLGSNQAELLKKALILSKEDYYYAKWTSFPRIIHNGVDEKFFSVRIYFLETMMRNRTMYIQYDFNQKNYEIEKEFQSYGKIYESV